MTAHARARALSYKYINIFNIDASAYCKYAYTNIHLEEDRVRENAHAPNFREILICSLGQHLKEANGTVHIDWRPLQVLRHTRTHTNTQKHKLSLARAISLSLIGSS